MFTVPETVAPLAGETITTLAEGVGVGVAAVEVGVGVGAPDLSPNTSRTPPDANIDLPLTTVGIRKAKL